MKLYCTRDATGSRSIWHLKPKLDREYDSWYVPQPRDNDSGCGMDDFYGQVASDNWDYHMRLMRGLFPKGVKRGECMIVWVPRFEVFK